MLTKVFRSCSMSLVGSELRTQMRNQRTTYFKPLFGDCIYPGSPISTIVLEDISQGTLGVYVTIKQADLLHWQRWSTDASEEGSATAGSAPFHSGGSIKILSV